MTAPEPVEVLGECFDVCVTVLEALDTPENKAALLAGLTGHFLAGVPWQSEAVWSEAISSLALEAAAVARDREALPDAN